MACPVLIAEDSRNMAQYLSMILKKLGYNDIDLAEDGRKALNLIAQKQYSFIILDQNMPVMTGIEVLRDIKFTNMIGTTPVMMITGSADRALIQTIRDENLPVTSLLGKPFSFEAFQRKFNIIARYIKTDDVLPKNANQDGKAKARTYSGASMQGKIISESKFSGISFSGSLLYEDRFEIKKVFDAIISMSSPVVAINMTDVQYSDEFFIGFLLMFSGTVTGAGRKIYLISSEDSRVVQVGVGAVIPVLSDTAEFYRIVGFTGAESDLS